MRIGHVIETLAIGGMERLVVDLAMLQSRQGHDVAVYCIGGGGVLREELLAAGIPTMVFEKTAAGFECGTLRRLSGEMRRGRREVVHTHNPRANMYGAVAARFAGARRVINTRHGMGGNVLDNRREARFRISLAFTDAVAFVCRRARERFTRANIVSPSRSSVVYNGIDLERFQRLCGATRTRSRQMLGITPGELVVGAVGRLEEVKNMAAMIELAQELAGEVPRVRFVIAGDGTQRAALERSARACKVDHSILFLGYRRDVAELMKAFDVFVLPSLSEGLSLTLIEAMAAGSLVIASNAGGNPEVVEDGTSGFIVPATDIRRLTTVLVGCLRDGRAREQFGEAARRRAFQCFDMKQMNRAYLKLYGGEEERV